MKRIIRNTLAVIVVLCLVISTATIAFAEKVIKGEPNYGFTCELDTKSGVLTIGGLGMLFAGDVESALNTNDMSIVKEIVIKEGITLIHITNWLGPSDFSKVKKITIPETLKRIRIDTFVNCESLEEVNYGGDEASWKNIIFDEGNELVETAKVNYNCSVPQTEGADKCEKELILEKSYVERNYKCTMDFYTGVFTVSPISTVSSAGVRVTENLSEALYIETKHFDGYYADSIVEKVVFESGISEIGTDVLRNKKIKSVVIPKSVKKIADECFGDMNNFEKCSLTDVYYTGDISDWNSIDIGINNIPLVLANKHYNEKVSAKELKFKLSATNYVYDGELKYPEVTVTDAYGELLEENTDFYVVYYSGVDSAMPGKYKILVKFIGEYSGRKTLSYYVRPKAPVISSASKRDGGFTVTWNKYDRMKNGSVDGYEVQYSTSSDFKSSTTITMKNRNSYAKKVTGLKSGKKYYVRVRAIKNVGSGYIRSAWSSTKTVKAG